MTDFVGICGIIISGLKDKPSSLGVLLNKALDGEGGDRYAKCRYFAPIARNCSNNSTYKRKIRLK